MKKQDISRRQLLSLTGIAGISGLGVAAMPSSWTRPIINSVVLPAHAQTSMCLTDTSVGGPLTGHPSGASSCQAACEAEATAQSAQLCAVTETLDMSGDTICGCDLDLP